MECLTTSPPNITQLMSIMNLIHRLAVKIHSDSSSRGMSPSQLSVIGFLYFSDQQNKEVYQRDVENFFKLRRSTISSLLNSLEKKGLIQRLTVPHDARLKKLVLTPEGMDAAVEVHQCFQRMSMVIFQGLTQEELDTMKRILNKMEQNLGSEDL